MQGQDVVMIGHSEIVGRPAAMMLKSEGATVTVCHHMTRSLVMYSRRINVRHAARVRFPLSFRGTNKRLRNLRVRNSLTTLSGTQICDAGECNQHAAPLARGHRLSQQKSRQYYGEYTETRRAHRRVFGVGQGGCRHHRT